jgi:hypothetical protein
LVLFQWLGEADVVISLRDLETMSIKAHQCISITIFILERRHQAFGTVWFTAGANPDLQSGPDGPNVRLMVLANSDSISWSTRWCTYLGLCVVIPA